MTAETASMIEDIMAEAAVSGTHQDIGIDPRTFTRMVDDLGARVVRDGPAESDVAMVMMTPDGAVKVRPNPEVPDGEIMRMVTP